MHRALFATTCRTLSLSLSLSLSPALRPGSLLPAATRPKACAA